MAVCAGLLCGILAGFGIGGGSLLMLHLTFFAGFSQPAAAGILPRWFRTQKTA